MQFAPYSCQCARYPWVLKRYAMTDVEILYAIRKLVSYLNKTAFFNSVTYVWPFLLYNIGLWIHDEKRKETERPYTESNCTVVFCESGSHIVMAHYKYCTTHTHTNTPSWQGSLVSVTVRTLMKLVVGCCQVHQQDKYILKLYTHML